MDSESGCSAPDRPWCLSVFKLSAIATVWRVPAPYSQAGLSVLSWTRFFGHSHPPRSPSPEIIPYDWSTGFRVQFHGRTRLHVVHSRVETSTSSAENLPNSRGEFDFVSVASIMLLSLDYISLSQLVQVFLRGRIRAFSATFPQVCLYPHGHSL